MSLISVVQVANACFGSAGAVTTLNTLGSSNDLFASTMTSPACKVWVQNAGAAGGDYQGSVASYASNASIGITPNATANVTGKLYAVGIGCTVSQNGAVFTITLSGVSAGDLIHIGCNTDPAVTISSVSDNVSSVWGFAGAGISNGTYFQRAMRTLSAGASGTVVVTVTMSGTPAAENTSFGILEATGGIWSQDPLGFATGNGTGTTVATGALTTAGPNSIVVGQTGVDNYVSGGFGSYTGNPSTGQCHSDTTKPDDMFGDTLFYEIFTSKQTSITPSVTQASGGYLITAVSYSVYVPSPSYASPVPSYSSDSAAARTQVLSNVKPSVPAALKPPAVFPDVAMPRSDSDAGRHAAQSNVKPSVGAVFRPQASYADRGAYVSNFALESGAGSQSTPSPLLYTPNPQASFPDAPFPGSRSVASDFSFGRFFAFASAAKNPTASYPDAGSRSGTDPEALLPVFTRAFLAIPTPRATFPDAGSANSGVDPQAQLPFALGVAKYLPSPPNPSASFADVGNQRPTYAASWDPSLLDVSKFVPSPPKPNPSYPDRGNQQPVPQGAHAADGSRYYFAPAVTRVVPAVFSDVGSQQAPPAWRAPWASGLTFVAPVPKPVPSYADRGSGYQTPPSAHLEATRYPFGPPPTVLPSGSFPERGSGYQTPASAHLAVAAYFKIPIPIPSGSFPERGSWADPPSHLYAFDLLVIPPPLNPQASFPDRGEDPPARVHLATAAFFKIAIPAPSGVFPERGSAYQAPSHHFAHNVNVIPPPLNPAAVFPNRGEEPPARVHMAASGPAWVAPVPKPSGSYPDRGSAWQPPSHLYALALRIPPPPINPQAVYPDKGQPPPTIQHMAASGLTFVAPVPKPSGSFPDRSYGYQTPASAHMVATLRLFLPPSTFPVPVYPDVPMPSSWAQDMGDQPYSLFVFFLTGPYRSSPSDEPALAASASDEPALSGDPGDE